MINTLRLAQRLEAARMSREQAETLATELDASLTENYVTKEFLDARLSRVVIELTIAVIVIVGAFDAALFWGISLLLQQHK